MYIQRSNLVTEFRLKRYLTRIKFKLLKEVFATNSHFLILISVQPNVVDP